MLRFPQPRQTLSAYCTLTVLGFKNFISVLKLKKLPKKTQKILRLAACIGNKFDLKTNKVVGCEALIRWQKEGRLISPMSFIPVAEETGNLTIRAHSIVSEVVYDEKSKKASGVKIIDGETKEEIEFFARIIFCNASTVGTTAILLNSRSETFPNGIGNSSGELGHNLMDHHYGMGVSGILPGFEDTYYKGRKPVGFYIPRFSNIDKASVQNYQKNLKNWFSLLRELKKTLLKP